MSQQTQTILSVSNVHFVTCRIRSVKAWRWFNVHFFPPLWRVLQWSQRPRGGWKHRPASSTVLWTNPAGLRGRVRPTGQHASGQRPILSSETCTWSQAEGLVVSGHVLNELSCCHVIGQPPICFDKSKCDCGFLAVQGTLPPPYSSSVPGGANGSLSSPVSTMTSQSSTSSSSLAKQRQSWLDLVSQATPSSPTCAEAAVVCSAQVHSRQPPRGSVEEVDAQRVLEGPSGCAIRQLESNEGDSSSEEDEVQTADCDAEEEEEGEVLLDVIVQVQPRRTFKAQLNLTFLFLPKAATNSDEMEKLYIHLKEASLSPTGQRKPSTKREFRASFIKRCKNQTLNDRLHQIRTLNSTLKVHILICTPREPFAQVFFFSKRKFYFKWT